jgi:pyruvate,water dikinase
VNGVCALVDARDGDAFGGKAVQLGEALRSGLPVPDGFAISHEIVDAVNKGNPAETAHLAAELEARCAEWPYWAVRSSAVGEDSDGASFAGIHKSLLNVCGTAALVEAVREVHASATDVGAVAYRGRMGLTTALRMAVVVQQLVDAEVGGVMFTRNPVTGHDERVIEASWGLGESVVSGMVTPDRYLVDPTGRVLERRVGEKDIAVRRIASGGTHEEPVSGDQMYAPCLHDRDLDQLHELALRCDRVFGMREHDIEFAFMNRRLYLLQRRPITGV